MNLNRIRKKSLLRYISNDIVGKVENLNNLITMGFSNITELIEKKQ